MSRTYRRVREVDLERIRKWHRARLALGNQKVFAARTGIPVAQIQVVLAKIRRGAL